LSWFALWAFNDLLRQEGITPRVAAFATACLAFNPLFFLLQGTFMTDVPALAFAMIALACYQRALTSARWAWLIIATVVAILGASTRQHTIVVPVVAGVLLGRLPQRRRQAAWWFALLLPVATGIATHLWFQARSDVTRANPALPPPAIVQFLPFMMLQLCGLLVLPVLALNPMPVSWKGLLFAGAYMGGSAFYWTRYNSEVAVWDNVILFPYTVPMFGPWGAFAGHFIPGQGVLLLSRNTRLVLTILGCAGGAELICRFVYSLRPGSRANGLLLFTLMQVPFLFASPKLLDRYALMLLPGALYACVSCQPRFRLQWVAGGVMLTASALASIALMHDWLSWNAARWTLGQRALSEHGIRAFEIEGGLEWDGWYAPPRETHTPALQQRTFPRKKLVLPTMQYFKFDHISGEYALAFQQFPGSTPIDSQPYTLWLAPGRHLFWLLQFDPRYQFPETSPGPSPPTDGPSDR
jgi:4-amino-4-deoxy-L-arabinose transferase-like glycosyltransferase